MKRIAFACIVFLVLLTATAEPAAKHPVSETAGVSAQGILRQTATPLSQCSPLGTYTMEIIPVKGDIHNLDADLVITGKAGQVYRVENLHGNAFFIADVGRIVSIETCDSNQVPSRVTILDLEGQEKATRHVDVLSNPQLSPDGSRLVYRMKTAVVAQDLLKLEELYYPRFDLFAAGPAGRLAGVFAGKPGRLSIYSGQKEDFSFELDSLPRRILFSVDGSFLYLLTRDEISRLSLTDRRLETIYSAPQNAELRDLQLGTDTIQAGMRYIKDCTASGERITLDLNGRILSIEQGPSKAIPGGVIRPAAPDTIPWPLAPDEQHAVGITYGEFQNYAGGQQNAYLHGGVDIMGQPGDPVYAVRDGFVKAVLTTSGEYHWRVAVGESDTSGTCEGYLYAHLEESSIAVHEGDAVTAGQYLGDLVEFFVNFHHLHFSKIRDTGTVWQGLWLYTGNPHLEFENQDETQAPVFKPATHNQLFAFCFNQTDVYQNPDALQGQVDMIVQVEDYIASNYPCTVQELRYTIYPAGHPESPVVDDKQAVFYDMTLDSDQEPNTRDWRLVNLLYKQDETCGSQMDLTNFAYYHIITNSDGDQNYEDADRREAWDTTALPDGDYVIEVTAVDVAGNAATESMQVTTFNGLTGSSPDTMITMGPQGPVSSPILTFTFTGVDAQDPPSGLLFSHRIDQGPWSSFGSSTTATYTNLGEGLHVFQVRARNSHGDIDPVPAIRSVVVEPWENVSNWDYLVTGPGPGPYNPPLVRTGQAQWLAYGVAKCGVNVACGNLDGSGFDEVITGPGPSAQYGPHVRGFRGNGIPLAGVSFFAYGTHKYGVNVKAGDIDGDGFDEILTGAGPGAVFGPHVRGWNCDGGPAAPIPGVNFIAYGTRRWGVNVTCGDIDGDGFDEILTGAGPGAVFGPHVRGWNYDAVSTVPMQSVSFIAYGTRRYGVNVACGDIDNDGYDEILTGAGPGAIFSSHVRAWHYDGASISPEPAISFFAYTGSRYGVVVDAINIDPDFREEILTMPGPDPAWPAHVRVWDFRQNHIGVIKSLDFIAYDQWMTWGGNIAGSNIN